MNIKKFIGVWKLKSYDFKTSDGNTIYPNGKNPIGYLMYAQNGYMSVIIMSDNREKFHKSIIPTREFWDSIPTSSKISAYESFFAYYGRFEVKNEECIIHHLIACSIPDWIGTAQKRFYKFENNFLTLSIKEAGNITTLTWERV